MVTGGGNFNHGPYGPGGVHAPSATPDGQGAYYDLVAGVAAEPCTDADFDDFREALRRSGVSASRLLEVAEENLARTRNATGSGS